LLASRLTDGSCRVVNDKKHDFKSTFRVVDPAPFKLSQMVGRVDCEVASVVHRIGEVVCVDRR